MSFIIMQRTLFARTLLPSLRASSSYSTVVAPASTPISTPFSASSSSTATESPIEEAAQPSEPPLLPYCVRRTLGGGLPVYGDVLHGGSKYLTIIRKVDGDLEALRRDLSDHLSDVSTYTKPHARQVVLKGDFVRETKEWLAASGF